MEGQMMTHFSHEHPLFLKGENRKANNGNDDPDTEITSCNGCSTPLVGPFYGCEECPYFLHKTCAELPKEMKHPMHPEHLLTLLLRPPYPDGKFKCNLCYKIWWSQVFVYNCSTCRFDVDMICASASHTIVDKCHPHPLTSSKVSSFFICHICQAQENSLSYKCNICPFWVHQNCTLLENTVIHGDHEHNLTLLSSVPSKYKNTIDHCDICYDPLFLFQCSYYCEPCMFFAHVSCATSESNQDFQRQFSLPIQQKSTNLIIRFVEHYIDLDAKKKSTSLITQFVKSYIEPVAKVENEINHFSHSHSLLLVGGEQTNEKICDACLLLISTPSYDCSECGYSIHKWCTELPKSIKHPFHPAHELSLQDRHGFSLCKCCLQICHGFGYKCLQCEEDFNIDIRCASVLGGPINHEGHKHPLVPKFISFTNYCSACGYNTASDCTLRCDTCSFNLCFPCAMMPAVVSHRYDTHPFVLTYSPHGSDYDDYFCDLCEKELNPKFWHYNCRLCDRFIHLHCMRHTGAGSSIKYGRKFRINVHEHNVTVIDCTYNYSPCSRCRNPMVFGYSTVGIECVPCNYRTHLSCIK